MDDNAVQYQQRTKSYLDWEALEIMLDLADETAIDYVDYEIAKDYVKLCKQLNEYHILKWKYDRNHSLWLHALGFELKIKNKEKEVSSFFECNSSSLKRLFSISRNYIDRQDRIESAILLCDYRKKRKSTENIIPGDIDILRSKIEEVLFMQEYLANHYFNKLICAATVFCVTNYTKRNNDFLLSSELALVDTMVFTVFINSREFLSITCREDLARKCERIYYQNSINVLTMLLSYSKSNIEEIFQNRFELFKRLYNASHETRIGKYDSVITNFRFILIQDKVLGKYKPFFEDSAIDLISIFEIKNCVDEINEYLTHFFELYNSAVCEARDYINAAEGILDSCDEDSDMSDENESNQPINSLLFDSLSTILKQCLDTYCKEKAKAVLFAFNTALFKSLACFSNGESGEEFDFSIKNQDESGIQYIDFHSEENIIDVVSGGMALNSEYGSYSYINWHYSIWNNGDENIENVSDESFDDILYMFDSKGIQLIISTPDEFEFNSEEVEETLIDRLTEQLSIFEYSAIEDKILKLFISKCAIEWNVSTDIASEITNEYHPDEIVSEFVRMYYEDKALDAGTTIDNIKQLVGEGDDLSDSEMSKIVDDVSNCFYENVALSMGIDIKTAQLLMKKVAKDNFGKL